MQSPSSDRLALLYRLSQAFNSTLDLDEVLARVVDEVVEATRAERGFLMLYDEHGALAFRAARGIDRQTIERPEFQISRTVVDRVAREGRPLLTSNAQDDARLKIRTSVVKLGLRSILCVPLRVKDAVLGAVYVDNRLQSGLFTQDDLDLIDAIAASAAVAIDNARLFRDSQQTVRNLHLLHTISADLTSTLDLESVLTAGLERAQKALSSEAASILMLEGDELVFRVALGGQAAAVKPFRLPRGQGVAGWVVDHAQAAIVNDPHNDPRYYRAVETDTGFAAESMMAAPLIVNDRAIGVIEVFNKPGGYVQSDLDLLSTIAGSAAIALENARLYQVAVEKGRLERELQVARDVQASLLPRDTPRVPGWEFAARWRPARQVAGDFYDFISAGAGGRQGLGVVIADVSDKGMPAALFMSLARSIVRASVAAGRSPSEAIAQANRLICADAANGMFVTLFYARIAAAGGEMEYVNGGHNPPLWCRASSGECVRLTNTGMALGFYDNAPFEQRSIRLDPGDFVLFYTDGVTEAMDAQRREFGEDRLRRVLIDSSRAPAGEVAAALDRALVDHSGASDPHDDITFVIARRVSTAG